MMVSKIKVEALKRKYPLIMQEIQKQAFRKAINYFDKEIADGLFNVKKAREEEGERINELINEVEQDLEFFLIRSQFITTRLNEDDRFNLFGKVIGKIEKLKSGSTAGCLDNTPDKVSGSIPERISKAGSNPAPAKRHKPCPITGYNPTDRLSEGGKVNGAKSKK